MKVAKNKGKRKLDKSKLMVRILAGILAAMMVLGVATTLIFALMG